MGRHGDPAARVQRAAGHLRSSATFLETVLVEEGLTTPVEVWRALVTIRAWTATLGAHDPQPDPTAITTQQQMAEEIRATPQPRQPMRRTRR